MNELKKCPFCGGEVELVEEVVDAIRTAYGFHCDNCDMSTYYDYYDREEAIKHWNNRKPVENVLWWLESELFSSDEEMKRCSFEDPLQFDAAKGYATGIYNSMQKVKEEFGVDSDVRI